MKIAVDFDGTIVEHAYPKIGKEMSFAFATLKELEKQGHKVIVRGEYGVVNKQYPKANTEIKNDLAITLFI